MNDPEASRVAATDTTWSGETPAEEHHRRGELPAELRASSSRIGRFTLLGALGEGGMGVVYAAYDEILDRRVAIKMVRTDRCGGDAHARMLREAKALAQLSHPNVVQVYEVSASAGRIFIAMEYVRGSTLRAMLEGRLRRGAPMQEVLDLFLQAGRGLAAAHAVGLAHRDFKADNVIVGEDGRVRVIDFGLATALDLDDADGGDATLPEGIGLASPRLTATNAILGTPAYMSPEQLAGQPVDARADQFSYCVALHEALCGVRPFPGGSLPEILQGIAQGVRQGPSGALPEWLAAVLRRGLAFDPGARFPSMQALLDALERNPGARRRRRRRALALVTAGAALTALVALLVIEIGRRWVEHGRERDAEAALTAAEARIGETRAAGDDAHARELFAAFVDDPAHDGTRAQARAWLAESERRLADGAQDGAREALAAAYASAPAPDLQVTALRGLAGLLREGRRWDALAGLLALLDREHPDATADIAGLRVDAALARRDLPGARQYLALAADPRSALVEAILPATSTVHHDLLEVHSTGPHTLLHHVYSGSPRLDRVRSAPSLEPAVTLAPVEGTDWLVFVHGDPPLVVGYEWASRTNTLYRIAEASLDPLHRWRGPQVFVGASTDLDGDGRRELYLGTGTGLEIIEVIAEPGGGYREVVVYSTADTLESLPHAMLAADLDGDGREELALSFTGWWAYDIRVLRRGPDGHLVTAARDKIGSVRDLNTLRDAAGRRLLVSLNAGREENTLVFPPDHPKGDDEGLYLHAFDGQRLTRVLHLPLLAAPDSVGWFRGVIVADVDGNGLDDIIVSFEEEGEGSVHALIHLQVDGGFTPVLLGQLQVLAAAQLDDDPAQELIVGVSGGDPSRRVWVLGAGDGPLPPVPAPSIAAPRPIDSDDPAWTRRWRQAEVLRDLGLDTAAADAFERLARGAPTPLLRAATALQAGDLRVRLGEHRPALALLHAATRDPGLRSEGLRKVLALEIRLGDYEAAEATLDELGGDLDPALAALAELVRHARTERVELRFDRGLDPPWSIGDPLAIRWVPGEDGLDLATLNGGEVLSLPVLWSGALLDLSVDLTFVEGEATSSVEVAIVPEDDPGAAALLAARMTSIGSQRGGIVRRELWFDGAGESRAIPLDQSGRASGDPQRVRIRASLHPDRRQFGVALDDPRAGKSLTRFDPIARPLPAAGRYRLIVRSRIESPAWLRARLHRIDVRGARVAPEPAAAAAAFRRAIVEGEPVAVLAAAGALVEPSVDERLAQAHAHLQVGEVTAARAIWSELLAADGPPPRALLQLLRANPELYGPHLRELLGARYFGLLADVWRAAAVNHLGDPRPRQALHAVLATLDAAALLAVDDPALLAAACELLRWRAAIHGRTGDLVRARADLERVVASLDRLPAEAPLRAIRWQIWLDLASMAAQDGDPRRARAAIDAALEVSAAPGIVGDVVRARPELAALGG